MCSISEANKGKTEKGESVSVDNLEDTNARAEGPKFWTKTNIALVAIAGVLVLSSSSAAFMFMKKRGSGDF